jgi:DNA-binding transcriptional regulator YiaG
MTEYQTRIGYVVEVSRIPGKRPEYVMQHRRVASEMAGRALDPGEHVHHINGIKHDNRPENLQILTRGEHIALHAAEAEHIAAVANAAREKRFLGSYPTPERVQKAIDGGDVMDGKEMKRIRRKFDLSVEDFGKALGYAGTKNTISTVIRRYEANMRPIPGYLARLVTMFDMHGIPDGFFDPGVPKRGPNASGSPTAGEDEPAEQ